MNFPFDDANLKSIVPDVFGKFKDVLCNSLIIWIENKKNAITIYFFYSQMFKLQ